MVFDPVKEGGVELFDPIAEGGIALEEPLEEPLEPKVAFDRAGEIWDISVDLQIPLSDAEENYNKIVSKKPDTPKPSDDLGSIVSRPLTKPEIEEEKTLQEEIERAAFLQKHPQLLRQLQRQQEDQLIQDYFNSLPEARTEYDRRMRKSWLDSALKLDGWHRKVHLAKAKRFQIEKLRGEGKIPDERRVYTGFWNELGRNTVGGSLNVASGLIGTLASASEGAIWDKDKLEEWANSIHKLSSKPAFTASKEGGWKGFIAASVGQAFPYMAASTAAVITTGQPYAAFAVGFSVEGDNAYRTALANGASEEEAQLNRFVVGTINGAIEQLQVSQLLKFAKVGSGSIKAISKAAQDRAMKKILAAGSKLTLNSLHHFSREALEETLQEFTSIAAEAEQNPDAWLFATDRILKAGLGGGVVGLLLGTGGAMRTQTPTTETPAVSLEPKAEAVKAQEKAEAPKQGVKPEKGIKVPSKSTQAVQAEVTAEGAIGEGKGETISERLAGKKSATIGTMTDTKDGRKINMRLVPDISATGTYSVVISEGGRSQTIRMQYEGGKNLVDAMAHFKEYMNTDEPSRFAIDVQEVVKKQPTPPAKQPKGFVAEKKAELRKLKAIRFKTANDEKKIKRIQKQIQENVSKWEAGQGVGWRVAAGQVNRGLRITEIYPDTHTAKIEFIKDVGQLADYKAGSTHIVDTIDLIRDKRYDSLARPAPAAEKKVPAKLKKIESVTKPERDILGGVDPLMTIQRALKEAKAVQPKTKSEKAVELRRRVGAAAGAMKSNVKKGVPAEEAIFKSTGLLKGPLTEYDQLFTSIEDILEPGAKEAAYAKIYKHPDLQYFEILNTATSFKKLLAGTGLTPGDVKNIENIFGKTFEEFTKVRTVKSDLYDRAIAIWKAGLLTGIKTSGLNTLANLSHSMTETAKDIPAALVDSVTSLFTGDRALAFTAKGTGAGIIEGVKRGWRYLSTGYDERNIGAKLDYKAVHFGNSKIAKGLQVYEETIFHLLGAEDQPFYYGAKARSLFSQAIAKAKNKGLKGKERDGFVENLVKNPTDDMLIAAAHDAEVAVFQNRTKFGDIARSIQKVKGGEVIVPFGRTPSAVATQIINYSPVGAVKEVAQQIHDGEFNQRKFSQAFGRTAVGTAALFIGGLLLKEELMTLDHPDTERERELWKLEGRKANSVKIGGKWRSIQAFGPVGNVLIIGGHFQQELQKTGSPTKAIVKAFTGGGKSFSEQTFVRGMSSAIDALVSPETSFENWFSSMAGSAVPTIVADIARASDEIERRTEGPLQRIQIRVPGLRKKLPPKIDVFGQDLPRYGGNILETMADPSRPSKIRNDVVVDELRRLFDKDIKVTPTLLGDKMGFDILTTEENTHLWRRSGELTYKALLAWINTDEYKKVDNDFAKGKTIEALIGKTKAAAKAEMVGIKLNQGVGVIELAESGLLSVESLDALKYFGESNRKKE